MTKTKRGISVKIHWPSGHQRLWIDLSLIGRHHPIINSAMAYQITGVWIVQSKEYIKAPRHLPLWGEFTGDRWIPRTKGQWRRKCFHLMTSSRRMVNMALRRFRCSFIDILVPLLVQCSQRYEGVFSCGCIGNLLVTKIILYFNSFAHKESDSNSKSMVSNIITQNSILGTLCEITPRYRTSLMKSQLWFR